ncbi:hypothetical protein QR680_009996 [Steinernema hermaphroditum]|uniref:Uncharacterized protein n=1 Tax=Steinernema hermaphroditum TaxID=289476 RepID=A0AA39IP92_9BILA|nr:hypothetical protein QR680_009996 [Steinernema hermaphroditum]
MKWSFSLAALCLLLQIPRLPCEEKLILPLDQILASGPIEPCKIFPDFNITTTTTPAPEVLKNDTSESSCG